MDKYIGKYRVKAPVDSNGNFTNNKNDTYVECVNKCQMYRYNNDILALYCPGNRFANKLRQSLSKFLTKDCKLEMDQNLNSRNSLEGEQTLYFFEKYIDEVAEIAKARTSGARIKPWSKKNIKKNKVNSYSPKDEFNYNLLKENMKKIVANCNQNIALYVKIYDFIERGLSSEINKYAGKVHKYAKEKNIKFVDALDDMGLIEQAIIVLENFKLEDEQ